MYLTDESDTVAEYEKKGLEKKPSSTQQDREREALQGMNHIQQIEMVQGKMAYEAYLKFLSKGAKGSYSMMSQTLSRKRELS